MQACVVVQVSRADEVFRTGFGCQDLFEQGQVALLDDTLEVGHLRVAQFDVN